MSDDTEVTPVQRDVLRAVEDIESADGYAVNRWVEMLYDSVIDYEDVVAELDALAAAGLVERTESDAYRLTDEGRALLATDGE